MKRLALILLSMTAVAAAQSRRATGGNETPGKPRLILAITVDQFRYDYLVRFSSEYRGGLKAMLDGGAVYTNARYEHFPTVTAVHALGEDDLVAMRAAA